MDRCRVLITGASGTGTTTLARELATRWSVPHADVDDYFWIPTSPPYELKRAETERLRLMGEVFLGRDAWVLSGSVMGWGDSLLASIDAIVFLTLDSGPRMARLRARESRRYGRAIELGGDLRPAHENFMCWAGGYDDPDFDGRNRVSHDVWLAASGRPVLHLDSARPIDVLVQSILDHEPRLTGPNDH